MAVDHAAPEDRACATFLGRASPSYIEVLNHSIQRSTVSPPSKAATPPPEGAIVRGNICRCARFKGMRTSHRILDYLDAAVQCEERATMASDPAARNTFCSVCSVLARTRQVLGRANTIAAVN